MGMVFLIMNFLNIYISFLVCLNKMDLMDLREKERKKNLHRVHALVQSSLPEPARKGILKYLQPPYAAMATVSELNCMRALGHDFDFLGEQGLARAVGCCTLMLGNIARKIRTGRLRELNNLTPEENTYLKSLGKVFEVALTEYSDFVLEDIRADDTLPQKIKFDISEDIGFYVFHMFKTYLYHRVVIGIGANSNSIAAGWPLHPNRDSWLTRADSSCKQVVIEETDNGQPIEYRWNYIGTHNIDPKYNDILLERIIIPYFENFHNKLRKFYSC